MMRITRSRTAEISASTDSAPSSVMGIAADEWDGGAGMVVQHRTK